MCFRGSLMEGGKEEAGKEEVMERRSDLRATVVDGGIEEAAMIKPSCSLWSERERISSVFFASYHWYILRHVAKALSKDNIYPRGTSLSIVLVLIHSL